MLLVTLLFAAWHVASHEIGDANNVSGHKECQVCRISHAPIVDLPIVALIVPLFIISLVLAVQKTNRPAQSFLYVLGARAPPLS